MCSVQVWEQRLFLGAYGAASEKGILLLCHTKEIFVLSTTRSEAVAMLPAEERATLLK